MKPRTGPTGKGRSPQVQGEGNGAIGPGQAGVAGVEVLAKVSRRLAVSGRTGDMLSAALEEFSGPLGLDFCLCYLLESGDKALRLNSQAGLPESVASEPEVLDVSRSFCGRVAQERTHRVEPDVQRSSDPNLQHFRSLGVRCYACFPLQIGGRLLGTLSFGSRRRDELAPEEVAMLEVISNQIAISLHLQRTTETARELDAVVDQRVEEQLESYTYSVTHDLRAPLRAIRGFAQALVEDYGTALDETGRDYLRRMEDGAARLDALLHDLLRYSRLGRAVLNLENVSVETCLGAVLESIQGAIAAANASIEVQRPLLSVRADAAVLQQALAELISNGIKFIEQPRPPQIRVWTNRHGAAVRIWVGDNGLGIAPAYHQRIFGVFERLHSTEAYPGTGIGLALVAKGAARMGGSVGVESALGAGSRFWIELPPGQSADRI